MISKENVSEALLEIGSVTINPTNPYKYFSGIYSPIFTDCRLINSFPKERRMVNDAIIQFLVENEIHPDIVIASDTSAISFTAFLSNILGIPMAYVRHVAKEHGTGKRAEGRLLKGQKALVVSDIISTKNDLQISIELLESHDVQVISCVAIFNNSIGDTENYLKDKKIKLYSLTDIKTLLNVALSKSIISVKDKNNVEDWLRDPIKWSNLKIVEISDTVMIHKKTAEILFDINSVFLNFKDLFRFSCGINSPIYNDTRVLISYPDFWNTIIDFFTKLIVKEIGVQNIDKIAGTETAAIAHSALIADRLNLPLVYVKKGKDDFGKGLQVEGSIRGGDRVLIIEDLVTTGMSTIKAARALRDLGGEVNYCMSIFTYGLKENKTLFKDEKISLIALTDLNSTLIVAEERRIINERECSSLLEWQKDPKSWMHNRVINAPVSNCFVSKKEATK